MSLTQHLLNGDGDPNLEGEESGAGLWQAKTALPASGPPCLSCVPVGESHSSGKNSDQLRSARSSLFSLPSIFLLARLQAGYAISGLHCELRRGKVSELGPKTEALQSPCEGHAQPLLFTPPLTGKQDCRPQLLLSAHLSCGHLVLCLTLPRAHRVKTFWPFLFRFLSHLQPLRGAWSPLLLFPAPHLGVSLSTVPLVSLSSPS